MTVDLSVVKDEHAYGKKMARKGCTKVIYKGTFISIQSLINNSWNYSMSRFTKKVAEVAQYL